MSRAEVICLASAKGGSGKTMLAATFGTVLADLGMRVLLIDTDAATNGLSLFYLSTVVKNQNDRSIARGLFETQADFDIVTTYATISDNLYLLPATYRFSNTEDVAVLDFRARLEFILTTARDDFDFVLIDAQAGSDEYAQVAMSSRISDKVVIVSEYDPMSAAGVERLKALLGPDLEYSRTWILLNKVLPEFAKSFSSFLEIARYLNPIPWDADVVRAYARRQLSVDVENGNSHTLAVLQALRVFLPEIEDDLDHWLTERSTFLRDSIDKQMVAIESSLAELNGKQKKRSRRQSRPYLTAAGISAILLGAALWLILAFGNGALAAILAFLGPALGVAGVIVGWRMDSNSLSPTERAERVVLEDRLQKLVTLRDLDAERLVERSGEIP